MDEERIDRLLVDKLLMLARSIVRPSRFENNVVEQIVAHFGQLLQSCGDACDLPAAKRVQQQIISHGLESDVFLAKHSVHTYLKCNSVDEARQIFNRMHSRNVILWTGMITAYARNGDRDEGMLLFKRMQLEGVTPNRITFLSALTACSTHEEGRTIHALIALNGFDGEISVATALVRMYSRCGSLIAALEQFHRIPHHSLNLVAWSVAIAACNHHNQPDQALALFRRMQLQGVPPDAIALVALLDACSRCGSRASLPDDVLTTFDREAEVNVIVGTALLTMFAKCGSLQQALLTFSKMKTRNVVSWTALITAYSDHGRCNEAIAAFRQMQLEGLPPNPVAFVAVLNACDLVAGRSFHHLVIQSGLETDTVLGNALVSMYGRCGRADEARQQFDKLMRFNSRNLVLWNGMFAAYASHGDYFQESLELFAEMQLEGVKPNKASYASILLHSRRSLKSSPRHLKLIDLCAEEGGLKEAIAAGLINTERICSGSRSVGDHDVVWWTALIAECQELGLYAECREFFARMQLEGVKPNEVTLANALYVQDLKHGRLLHQIIVESEVVIDIGIGTALVNLYSRSQMPEEGYEVFLAMQQHSTVSWTAMILCFSHNQLHFQALELFRRMHYEGLKPDAKTFTSVLSSCSSSGSSTFLPLSEIESIHACIGESGFDVNHFVNTTLLSVYSKCGTLQQAREMFQRSHPLQTSSWSSMIAAASHHGFPSNATVIFSRMQQEGARADEITLLCLLAACSHGGMADKALNYFLSMKYELGVERNAEHCCCIADMLGRAGRLEDAEELIRKMPFEAPVSVWMTLLNACRTQGDLGRARQASAHVSGLNPQHAQNYLVLSNAYAEGASKGSCM